MRARLLGSIAAGSVSLLVVMVAVGCGGDSATTDVGDAGGADMDAATDGASRDGMNTPTDAGHANDGGQAMNDAGASLDAGGSMDAGALDSGSSNDAGPSMCGLTLAGTLNPAGDHVRGTLTGASRIPHEKCESFGGAAEAIYAFTLTSKKRVDLTLSDPAAGTAATNTILAIRSACADQNTELGCKEATSKTYPHIQTDLDAGTYYVVVDRVLLPGDADTFGSFTLDFSVSNPTIPCTVAGLPNAAFFDDRITVDDAGGSIYVYSATDSKIRRYTVSGSDTCALTLDTTFATQGVLTTALQPNHIATDKNLELFIDEFDLTRIGVR